MKVLYIGQYTEGTTSKMRADALKEELNSEVFKVINTHEPFYNTHRIWRSMAFRLKFGPTITAINYYIKREIDVVNYDLIWVDKATFVSFNTTKLLRERTKHLVHYTPDMMFYDNNSKAFLKSLALYDLVITTKRRELLFYRQYIEPFKVKLVTQGYAPNIHRGKVPFEKKTDTVVFIGLAEPSRLSVVQYLIDQGITVVLAGPGWKRFASRNKNHRYLKYMGNGVYGESYSYLMSSSKFGLGLLSKRFPELHTTRTFEIPACGTALLTERNKEMEELFNEDEVIYFDSKEDLAERIKFYIHHSDILKEITMKGQLKVADSGYDNYSIIRTILNTIKL